MSEEHKSEDMAEMATVTGWVCKKCKRFWEDDERMARYCCSTSFPCECGNRYEKGWTSCEECRLKIHAEQWLAKPAVEWDGSFPIGLLLDDQFFWSKSELLDWITERDDETEGLNPRLTDDDWLTTCEPMNGSEFVMRDFLCDDLHEDQELDEDGINKTVNDWITANAPYSWTLTGERLCLDSVRKHLGI